jgi:hypothetical protein
MMGQDISKKVKNLEGGPFGLASVGNNWWEKNNHAMNLKNGFIMDTDIIHDFKNMRIRINKKRSPLLTNDNGELKTFPAKSRWNEEYNYGWVVGQKALDEVKGLRRVSHLVLTVSSERVETVIPDWWCYGDEEYMAVVGGYLVSEFLRKLRAYRKKRGLVNNFVTWVMEFQKNGMVHFHLLFYGGWIGELDDLKSFWPYCEGQGVRLGKPINHQYGGEVLVRYLTRYITKDLQNITEKKKERIAAFLWFFRRRLYNMRHRVRNSDGKYTIGIGREHYKPAVKWRLYESDIEDKKRLFPESGLEQDWKEPYEVDVGWKKEFYGQVLKPLKHS